VDGDEVRHRRAARHGVEERPVGDRIGAVAHVLRHDVGMRHRGPVEVVAGEGHRRDLAFMHQPVNGQGEPGAFAVP